ncbi:Orn/Lys/Arg decarboxylase N-terminal domain-containing protein [Spongiactinospora sp. TRM90649]|uniref:Orn/Lys/Arg family decarboxylase n=1 Tax=Spongiactinospora sp. TRM90649 TaxID=3031114 RepID=UPI0023F76051|nr:Orn/Lys/Arg decarboxylase N-terminal domain-containing protein [Spongiactinospora sp. TRM90649]MDF5752470.1 Orn/Lys/Arg decarboxylase N-terminal domain-containing protein [Spongiactinospora sp. TRM90649]
MQPTVLAAVTERPDADTALAEQLRRVRAAMEGLGLAVRWTHRTEDALAVIGSDASLAAVLAAWDAPEADSVLGAVAGRFRGLPVFLMSDEQELPLWVYEVIQGYVFPLEDTPDFIAGRIAHAAEHYSERILPPFFAALRRLEDHHRYSWHTPAHAGGVAFLKSPVGRAFFDFYGERLLRTDLSISVPELGSPLDHTGPIGEAERNAARVFGADRTFFVVNGNSTANRIVGHHAVARDDTVLVDRNCHKSVQHALTVSGARPVYLVPERNGLGLAGPIPPAVLAPDAVRRRLTGHPLAEGEPALAVITNSTYDGVCHDAVRVAELLGATAPRIHFDEAWFAYARFNPLYARRYAMAIDEDSLPGPGRPTVFATQSTHKLLAALSQAAMLHVRPAERAPVDYDRFNETYLMHASTSPLYPMIASLDVAAAMMDGPSGPFLTGEAIVEAVRFRQAMARLAARVRDDGRRPGWFFGVWQPPQITDPRTGRATAFADADPAVLSAEPACWTLEPGAAWHGFTGLTDGYALLDPIKVTITCPGADAVRGALDWGIPARIVAAYLERRGIVVEKTGDHTLLVLFSMGITKGKWGTLIDALTDFKNAYDDGLALAEPLPGFGPPGVTLRDHCARAHRRLRDSGVGALLDEIFTTLPEPVMTPADAYQALIRARTERVPLRDLPGRIAAATVVVTPPGIPMLMPGESTGPAGGPLMAYLRALEEFDLSFPEMATDIHGVHRDSSGRYQVEVML